MSSSLHDRPAAGPELLAATLPPVPDSARQARGLVRDSFASKLDLRVLDTLLLLTTELVSNALDYTGDPCELRVSWDPQGLVRVEVADTNAVLPGVQQPGATAESGRGLLLVDALADGWGATPATRGKVMWFVLRF